MVNCEKVLQDTSGSGLKTSASIGHVCAMIDNTQNVKKSIIIRYKTTLVRIDKSFISAQLNVQRH